MNQPPASLIVDPQGKLARRPALATCPQCGRGVETRVKSSGFGVAHPVCPCGFEWFDEVWRG